MEHWISYLYQFGVGGILFFLTIFVAVKKKALRFNRKSDKATLALLLITFLLFLTFHGFWNYLALRSA